MGRFDLCHIFTSRKDFKAVSLDDYTLSSMISFPNQSYTRLLAYNPIIKVICHEKREAKSLKVLMVFSLNGKRCLRTNCALK